MKKLVKKEVPKGITIVSSPPQKQERSALNLESF